MEDLPSLQRLSSPCWKSIAVSLFALLSRDFISGVSPHFISTLTNDFLLTTFSPSSVTRRLPRNPVISGFFSYFGSFNAWGRPRLQNNPYRHFKLWHFCSYRVFNDLGLGRVNTHESKRTSIHIDFGFCRLLGGVGNNRHFPSRNSGIFEREMPLKP